MELRLPLEVSPGREATCRAVFGTWGSFPDDARAGHCPFVLTSFTGWSSERCPGIGFLSRGDREIGVLRNIEAPTRPRLECRREPSLTLRCYRTVGNPFQTKQGSRPSCPDQEGRKGSEEGVPENLGVPLEGDRGFGELCGSHTGCQVPFRPPVPNVGLLLYLICRILRFLTVLFLAGLTIHCVYIPNGLVQRKDLLLSLIKLRQWNLIQQMLFYLLFSIA